MRHTLVTILLVVFGMVAVSAQNEDTFRLREPSVIEYVSAMSAVDRLAGVAQTDHSNTDQLALTYLMKDEFWWRYGPDALTNIPYSQHILTRIPYAQLLELGAKLETSFYMWFGEIHRDWHNILFGAWLLQTQPDFASEDSWTFGDFTIEIEHVDFTGDGTDEILVNLQHHYFEDNFVLQNTPDGYVRLEGIDLWYSTHCSPVYSCSSRGEILFIDDLTDNGKPEVVTTSGACASGNCMIILEIWEWGRNEFVVLSDFSMIIDHSGAGGIPIHPINGDWRFENVDQDPEIEVIQIRNADVNQRCEFREEQLFQYDRETGQYRIDENHNPFEYVDSPFCDLRRAHDAMKSLDFELAARYYEHMLSFEPDPELIDIWYYARVRLAAAYALTGRLDNAVTVLEEIPLDEINDPMIYTTVAAGQKLGTTNLDGISLCVSLHNAIAEFDAMSVNDFVLRYVESNELHRPQSYGGGDFSPRNSGCDIVGLLEARIEMAGPDQPLLDQLQRDSWTNITARQFDLNNDGISEDIVWLDDVAGYSIFRWFDGEEYRAEIYSGDSLGQTSEQDILEEVALSVDRKGLASIRHDPDVECYPNKSVEPKQISIWILTEDGLQPIFGESVCQPQTLSEMFPVVGELHLQASVDSAMPEAYYWDETALSFSESDEHTIREILSGDLFGCDDRGTNFYLFCGRFNDPIATLVRIDEVLTSPPENATEQFLLGFQYYHALTLELLERPEEALAQYIAIYDNAPESPWGMLAELHLERIES